EQYQQGVEVSLKEHVYVYPLAEVAAVADVAMDQIVLALSRCSSVLNRQPIVVGGHVIHTGRRCSHAAINSLGAERSVQPQELRNIGPNKITRREAAKERARCDPATEFRSAEIGEARQIGSRAIDERIGVVLREGHIASERHPVVLGDLGGLFGAAE